ncbi:MAG: hypothetical protein QOI40_4519 [Alphaproteobacteria bacterium]|jgi:hypothetical protein|nr:hypothetical protein [Alphaproteobacteria bacterium]
MANILPAALLVLIFNEPALAAIHIPLHFHLHLEESTERIFVFLSSAAMAVGAGICFYKKQYRYGAILIGFICFPWLAGALFALSGIPVHWW